MTHHWTTGPEPAGGRSASGGPASFDITNVRTPAGCGLGAHVLDRVIR